jgi:hypothetical protein
LLLASCGNAQRTPATPRAATAATVPVRSPAPSGASDALFTRELEALPPLSTLAGNGWSIAVPSSSVSLAEGSVEKSEDITFAFEGSGSCACTIFGEAFDAASYVGNLVNEVKKSLDLVNIAPTRFSVEQEVPIYFVSLFYRKRSEAGVGMGQLKLALGMHPTRPMVCLHDVPGYTESFERVVRTAVSHYRVANAPTPIATTISVARVGTLPVGFSQESVHVLSAGRTQYRSVSAQIVPRSPNEVMVSDEAEVVVADATSLVEGHYVQGDLRGERLNVVLVRSDSEQDKFGKHKSAKAGGAQVPVGTYTVSGTIGQKPFTATFLAKAGMPGPDAISQRLRREHQHRRAFRFTQLEYHPSLDPAAPVEVTYSHTAEDPEDSVHVALGQLEVRMTVDVHGEPVKSELGAGSQTVVFERMLHRDDRQAAPKPATSH